MSEKNEKDCVSPEHDDFREVMLDFVNEIALAQVAEDRGLPLDEVLEGLEREAEALQETARQRGVPFEVALREALSGTAQLSDTGKM